MERKSSKEYLLASRLAKRETKAMKSCFELRTFDITAGRWGANQNRRRGGFKEFSSSFGKEITFWNANLCHYKCLIDFFLVLFIILPYTRTEPGHLLGRESVKLIIAFLGLALIYSD